MELNHDQLTQQTLLEQVKTIEQEIDQTHAQASKKKLIETHKNQVKISNPSVLSCNILDTTKLDQALRVAKRKIKNGQHAEAKQIYQDILKRFPKHKQALLTLQWIVEGAISTPKDPTSSFLQPIIDLYNQGHLQHALSSSNRLLERFPNSVSLYNIDGAANAGLMQFDAAINSYKQAIKINPNYAEAYYNMGLALSEKGELRAAIDSYKKAVRINPNYAKAYNDMGDMGDKGDLDSARDDHKRAIKISPHYAEVYYNMGNSLQRKGNFKGAIDSYESALKINPNHVQSYYNMGNALRDNDDLEAAIEKYKQVLKIKPDFVEAYNNMASVLQIKGDLKGSINNYQHALNIKPDHAACFVNCASLKMQIFEAYNVANELKSLANQSLNTQLSKNPAHQISLSINDFIKGDNPAGLERLQRYKELVQAGHVKRLLDSDQAFCDAYAKFIDHLIHTSPVAPKPNKNKIYHIGESHCLSYAHHTLTTEQQTFSISPVITIGAKAYHFSKPQENKYKSITRWNLDALPNRSIVFISFGEIDCRANKGLIQASHKTGTSLGQLVEKMIDGYLTWFVDANKTNQHQYHFFNVPAPVYQIKYTQAVNNNVANVVDLFNKILTQKVALFAFNLIDVYQPTKNQSGFSNNDYHSDEVHLDHRMLGIIERQIPMSVLVN